MGTNRPGIRTVALVAAMLLAAVLALSGCAEDLSSAGPTNPGPTNPGPIKWSPTVMRNRTGGPTTDGPRAGAIQPVTASALPVTLFTVRPHLSLTRRTTTLDG